MAKPETEKIKEIRKLLASASSPRQKAIYQMVLDAQLKLIETEESPEDKKDSSQNISSRERLHKLAVDDADSQQLAAPPQQPSVPSSQPHPHGARSDRKQKQVSQSLQRESLLVKENDLVVPKTETTEGSDVKLQSKPRRLIRLKRDSQQRKESGAPELESVVENDNVVTEAEQPAGYPVKPKIKPRHQTGSSQDLNQVQSERTKELESVVENDNKIPQAEQLTGFSLKPQGHKGARGNDNSEHLNSRAGKELRNIVENDDDFNSDEVTSVIDENLPDDAIYQAVGIMECEVYFISNTNAYILIDGNQYQLLYYGRRRKIFKALKKEIETTGEHRQLITVYPRVTHYPPYYQNDEAPYFHNISCLQENGKQKYFYQIRFQLTGFYKGRRPGGVFSELGDREFMLSGRWQYISVCNIPCITIYKNFDEELLEDVKKMNPTRKALFLQSCHIPLRWSNPPVEPFKYRAKNKDSDNIPFFVKVKARFLPSENLFELVEDLNTLTQMTPKFLKLYQRDKRKSIKYQAQVKAQAKTRLSYYPVKKAIQSQPEQPEQPEQSQKVETPSDQSRDTPSLDSAVENTGMEHSEQEPNMEQPSQLSQPEQFQKVETPDHSS